ncbi:MAG: hypothetical protein FWB95_02465 [Treponema sp.]|nr:hypothetical protein [Treponema sp.]
MEISLQEIRLVEIVIAIGVGYLIVSGIFKSVVSRMKHLKTPAGLELDLGGIDEQTAAVIKTIWKRFDELHSTLLESKSQYKEIVKSNEEILVKLREENKVIIGKQNDMQIDLYKVIFSMEDMNDEERLVAGLKYIYEGYNHQLKKDVIDFASKNVPEYRMAMKLAPHLKIDAIEDKIQKNAEAAVNKSENI